jgi:hypothetical protein
MEHENVGEDGQRPEQLQQETVVAGVARAQLQDG